MHVRRPDDHSLPPGIRRSVIAQILEEPLGISPVGIDDDFLTLGDHSLLATQVIAQCGQSLRSEAHARHVLRRASLWPGWLRVRLRAALTRPSSHHSRRFPGLAPRSYQQQALWLLDRMDGSSVQMNELGRSNYPWSTRCGAVATQL